MRYLYGSSDEKFVKGSDKCVLVDPLSTYKFRLNPLITGKGKEFDKNDTPLVFKCTPDKLLNMCVKVLDRWPLPVVYTWTIEDICKWLRSYGYRQYQNTFRENLITGRTLLLLDASALSAINIKDFKHIKHIAYGIRSLFFFEMTKFSRSITLYPEFHHEIFKLIRLKTGRKYDDLRRSDLWRKMRLIREKEPNYSHWEILERWLTFVKDPEYPELIGRTPRHNLYRCKPRPAQAPVSGRQPHRICFCLPPCECYWSEAQRRPPWRFQCLPHLQLDTEFVEECPDCIPPCSCRWSSKKYLTRDVLTCLQMAIPQKYGAHHAQNRYRYSRHNRLQSYRLSLI